MPSKPHRYSPKINTVRWTQRVAGGAARLGRAQVRLRLGLASPRAGDAGDRGFRPNPKARRVRRALRAVGQASKGSPPKRRSVLTVFPWSARVLREWLGGYRELFDTAGPEGSLWPTERSARLASGPLSARFAQYRDALGLAPELGLRCLRHSYVTHLIEAGYDLLFVQQQVGHSYSSATALYASVSSDYRARTLRAVLDNTVHAAMAIAQAATPSAGKGS